VRWFGVLWISIGVGLVESDAQIINDKNSSKKWKKHKEQTTSLLLSHCIWKRPRANPSHTHPVMFQYSRHLPRNFIARSKCAISLAHILVCLPSLPHFTFDVSMKLPTWSPQRELQSIPSKGGELDVDMGLWLLYFESHNRVPNASAQLHYGAGAILYKCNARNCNNSKELSKSQGVK